MTSKVAGSGTAADPWILSTPPGRSDFEAWRDAEGDPAALVVQVGGTQLRYQLRCIEDLHAMLKEHGGWIPLGNADEQKPAAEGTVEAWGRSPGNPVGGWYGLKRGLRGRFGNYVPPVLEALGLAEVEHNARNNRMRATLAPGPPGAGGHDGRSWRGTPPGRCRSPSGWPTMLPLPTSCGRRWPPAVIDQAIGVLMGQRRITAAEAFAILRTTSQNRNIKLRAFAAQIVAGASGSRPSRLLSARPADVPVRLERGVRHQPGGGVLTCE